MFSASAMWGKCVLMETPAILPPFDPWGAADRLGIKVVRTPLTSARGFTDGHSTVWVHDGLTQCEERSTLTHELCHITHGHTGQQPPEVETLVRKMTARWLIPWPCLTNLWGQNLPLEEVAAKLCVTPEVVFDRLNHATVEELARLETSCSLAA